MDPAIDPKRLTVDFSKLQLEAHVKKAVSDGVSLAVGKPIGAVHLLKAILLQKPIPNSAFAKLRSYFPNYQAEDLFSESKDAAAPVFLEEPLFTSMKVAAKYFRKNPTVWGRDFIAAVLLTNNDYGLRTFLQNHSITQEYLQDVWFDFLFKSKDDRIPLNLPKWWEEAGIPMPSKRSSNLQPETKDRWEVPKPGYISDELNIKDDSLNIRQEVNTLAAVILAKDVHPPLAIGLFGDWGHGKSFFMRSIRDQVNHVKENEKYRSDTFCKDAVQIEFNAWHYVDTNLWASLVSHILAELSRHVSPQATLEENHKNFLAELDSTKEIIEETKAQQKIAQKEIETKRAELLEVQSQRENKTIELKDLRPEDIYHVLSLEQKEELMKVLKRLGLPTAQHSVSNLEKALTETSTTTGRVMALFYSLFSSNNWLILLGTIVVVGAIIPIAQYLLHSRIADEYILKIAGIATKASAIITGIALTMKKGLQIINAGLSKVEEIKQQAEQLLKEKRKTPAKRELELEKEISKLNAREKETMLVLDSAVNHVAQLEERIRLLNQERSLNRFLTDRTSSDDYRKHLGIISTIRQDFESLTTRLANAHKTDDQKFRKVDRIILYIDDLDRCPSGKVMEVLQAVHLLLAYPLFVVIVGVDPRWLLHSLGSSYTAFQNSKINGQDAEWLTTPQNFLEKIFQIQFSLRPMESKGYEKLIKSLFSDPKRNQNGGDKVKTANVSGTTERPDKDKTAVHGVLAPDTASKKIVEATKGTEERPNVKDQKGDSPASTQVQMKTSPSSSQPEISVTKEVIKDEYADRFAINEESLIIRDWEVKFAGQLYEFIPSPRTAKRFSNIYRLLKAGIMKKDLAVFEGSEEIPGDFQVPMLLLGVVTGASQNAVKLFPDLSSKLQTNASVREAMRQIAMDEKPDSSYELFLQSFIYVTNANGFPDDSNLFLHWIPRVARYSFDLSRTLQLKQKEEKDLGTALE